MPNFASVVVLGSYRLSEAPLNPLACRSAVIAVISNASFTQNSHV